MNHRALLNAFFDIVLEIKKEDVRTELLRVLDKYEKLSKKDFDELLKKLGIPDSEVVHKFMQAKTIQDLQEAFISLAGLDFFKDFQSLVQTLIDLGYGDDIEFSGSLIRGFDYYDGIIFEMFDTNPENPRALFG